MFLSSLRRVAFILCLAVVLGGCGTGNAPGLDGGSLDGTSLDGGSLDGGEPDGGEPDGGCVRSDGGDWVGCVRTVTQFPVCGTDYRSYPNPSFAACNCAAILHNGSCLNGEGTVCVDGGPCGTSLYCAPSLGHCIAVDGHW